MANQQDEEHELRELLKRGMAPMRTELRRDLWPEVLRRVGERRVCVPWFDWALAAAATGCLVLLPRLIPALLSQL